MGELIRPRRRRCVLCRRFRLSFTSNRYPYCTHEVGNHAPLLCSLALSLGSRTDSTGIESPKEGRRRMWWSHADIWSETEERCRRMCVYVCVCVCFYWVMTRSAHLRL